MHIYHPAGTYIKVDTEGSVEIYVEKDVTKTVKGNLVETIEGNVTRTVKGDTIELFEGTFDKTVTGAWLRKSDVSIKDEAPTVDHN
jgi:hypothetical protein